MLRAVLSDSELREWTERTEEEATRRYWEVLPDDGTLVERFESVLRKKPEDFAPVNPLAN